MKNLSEHIQKADWKSEKHVPVIECPDHVKSGDRTDVRMGVGKGIAHSNTTEHPIRRIHFMQKVSILLIEENRFLRERIASMLKHHGDLEVIENGEDGDAMRQLKVERPPGLKSPPLVVLLNPGFEDGRGLKLMALLREELPEAKAIVMDILPDRADLVEFVKAGVYGFILKNAHGVDYVKTIKTVAEGSKVLPPDLTGSLFSKLVESAFESGRSTEDNFIQLTHREREIVNLISEGLGNKEIAAHLHIATYTVKSHIHNILGKLALNSRLQIAAFARKKASEWPGMEHISSAIRLRGRSTTMTRCN
jgi:DNA-binding NarL/FixJ family response regulator